MVRRNAMHFASVVIGGALIAPGPALCQETGQAQPPPPVAQTKQVDVEQIKQDIETRTKELSSQRQILEEQEKQLAVQKRNLKDCPFCYRLDDIGTGIDGNAPREDAGIVVSPDGSISIPADIKARQLDSEQFKQDLENQTRELSEKRRLLEEQENRLAAQKRKLDECPFCYRLEDFDTSTAVNATMENAPKAAPSEPSPNHPVGQAAPSEPSPTHPVGQAPQANSQNTQTPVAPIFDQPGVLTPHGKLVLEPSLQYSYSSSYRVALLGYTIVPAITIGLIDIRGVKDSIWISALTARYGLTNRIELEFKVPYVYRAQSSTMRPLGTPSTQDSVFDISGKGLGDLEVAARYQLNQSSIDTPYYVAGLRLKARNGKDPFSVALTDLPNGAGKTPSELPTGSGFVALQPSFSFIYPTDPAVLFGGVNYVKNFDRDVGNGYGSIHSGDAVGLNVGMGLALNEKTSFSIGLDYTSVGKPTATDALFPAATSTQLATLLFGYSYRLSAFSTLNLSVGAGLTPDTPGIQMTLRMPITY